MKPDSVLGKRLAQEEADIREETIEALRMIAMGRDSMTPAMKELLELTPGLESLWERFKKKASARSSAIEGTIVPDESLGLITRRK